ncbi:DUF1049 domain-containing protein [bacterium]|jgi:uncharacterized integral membrane protein|nr:DUF1049 domain-containing protein [bacterium]MBP5590450.1 DUF1049 domain-containing protein [bacterium]
MKLVKKLLFILVIALIAVMISYFARVNDTNVTLNLIFVSVKDIQLWLLSLFCFLAGVIFSVLAVFLDIMFMSGKERKLLKELKKLKSELSSIRNEKLNDISESDLSENGENLPAKEVVEENQEQI